MRVLVRSTVAVIGLAALAACGDSNEPKGLQLQDIAGSWQGTAFEVTELATGEKEEYMSKGYLAEFSMTVSATGR